MEPGRRLEVLECGNTKMPIQEDHNGVNVSCMNMTSQGRHQDVLPVVVNSVMENWQFHHQLKTSCYSRGLWN